MNDKTQTVLFATLVATLTVSLISTDDIWAVDSYYVDQWEVADKKITSLEEEIKNLEKRLQELEKISDEAPSKDQDDPVEKKIKALQREINSKTSQIDFLHSEIDRLERLNMESFKVDDDTEAMLKASLETIDGKYNTHAGFHSALIDFQDEALIIFVHPGSGLTHEQFERDVNCETAISVNEGSHGPVSCPTNDGTCSNPLYAGVEVKRHGDPGGPGTLGYYATHSNGARGFVVAGHVADFDGALITQPENGRTIGQVTEHCGQSASSCDGAFVDLNGGETGSNRIYKSGYSYYTVIGETPDSGQTLGTFVKKSGIGSGVTYGTIAGNLESYNYNTISFNSNNWVSSGDSGSPVFKHTNPRSNNVYLYGMLVGGAGSGQYGLYHPQDYLADQLDLQ